MPWRDYSTLAACLILIATTGYMAMQWRHPIERQQVYIEAWNTCLAEVRAQNPDYVLPPIFRNLTLNASAGATDTPDRAVSPDAAPSS